MKCELCKGEMELDKNIILTSYPPKHLYKCSKCGHIQYEQFTILLPTFDLTDNLPKGWVCPKCGAVMSPNQSTCPYCTPPQRLQIWC